MGSFRGVNMYSYIQLHMLYEEMDVGYFFTSIFMMCNTYFISTFISVRIVSCCISTNVNGVVNCWYTRLHKFIRIDFYSYNFDVMVGLIIGPITDLTLTGWDVDGLGFINYNKLKFNDICYGDVGNISFYFTGGVIDVDVYYLPYNNNSYVSHADVMCWMIWEFARYN